VPPPVSTQGLQGHAGCRERCRVRVGRQHEAAASRGAAAVTDACVHLSAVLSTVQQWTANATSTNTHSAACCALCIQQYRAVHGVHGRVYRAGFTGQGLQGRVDMAVHHVRAYVCSKTSQPRELAAAVTVACIVKTQTGQADLA
jgi:hypothetical protein